MRNQIYLVCKIYGGTINGNVFWKVKQGVVLATEWYGIIVLGNNNRGTMIVGNKINNATIGIGPGISH